MFFDEKFCIYYQLNDWIEKEYIKGYDTIQLGRINIFINTEVINTKESAIILTRLGWLIIATGSGNVLIEKRNPALFTLN